MVLDIVIFADSLFSHVAVDNAETKQFWPTMLSSDSVDPEAVNVFIRHEEWWTYDLFAPAVELRLEVPHFCFDTGSQLFEDTGLASTLSRRL